MSAPISRLFLLTLWVVTAACAKVQPISGGPKDLTPPKLIRSSPDSNATEVNPKAIILEFDEYIQARNLKKELLITPYANYSYRKEIFKNTLTLQFDSAYPENQTIVLNFRDGVKDITEQNSAEDLVLPFSTGPTIDSLTLSGTLKKALTKEPMKEALAALYRPSDTLDIREDLPYYFSKTREDGTFKITHIQEGQYRLYLFQDANGNYRYDSPKSEPLAIVDTLINISSGNEPNIEAEAAIVDETPPAYFSYQNADHGNILLEFNEGLTDFSIRCLDSANFQPYYTRGKEPSQIKLYNLQGETDTLRFEFSLRDSSYNRGQDTAALKFPEIRDTLQPDSNFLSSQPSTGSPLSEEDSLTLVLQHPLKRANQPFIRYWADSSEKGTIPFSKFRLSGDRRKLTTHQLPPYKNQLRITIDSGAFKTLFGTTNKADTLHFKKTQKSNKAIVQGKVKPRTNPYIVQLLNSNKQVLRERYNPESYTFNNLEPGKYFIRLIDDLNGNKKFDPGSYQHNKPAEPTQLFPKAIELKANWEVRNINF